MGHNRFPLENVTSPGHPNQGAVLPRFGDVRKKKLRAGAFDERLGNEQPEPETAARLLDELRARNPGLAETPAV